MHESGFIPRLLICDTHAKAQAVIWEDERSVPQGVQATWDNLIERLFERVPSSRQDEPLPVRCAPTAQKLFAKFQNEHVENVNNGISDLPEGYALRSAEKAFRVALALHAVEHEYCARKELSEQTASNAIKIVRWFDTQASALLQERMLKESEREVQRIFRVAREAGICRRFHIKSRAPVHQSGKSKNVIACLRIYSRQRSCLNEKRERLMEKR